MLIKKGETKHVDPDTRKDYDDDDRAFCEWAERDKRQIMAAGRRRSGKSVAFGFSDLPADRWRMAFGEK